MTNSSILFFKVIYNIKSSKFLWLNNKFILDILWSIFINFICLFQQYYGSIFLLWVLEFICKHCQECYFIWLIMVTCLKKEYFNKIFISVKEIYRCLLKTSKYFLYFYIFRGWLSLRVKTQIKFLKSVCLISSWLYKY